MFDILSLARPELGPNAAACLGALLSLFCVYQLRIQMGQWAELLYLG